MKRRTESGRKLRRTEYDTNRPSNLENSNRKCNHGTSIAENSALGQVLKLVIVNMTTEPDSGRHGDVLVIRSLSTVIFARAIIDILSDKLENRIM